MRALAVLCSSKTPHSAETCDQVRLDKNTDDSPAETGRDFMVQGQRRDIHTIFLKLQISDSTGNFCNIHFPFDIEADTATAVASEMVEELDLTDQYVLTIAVMIESEIRSHIPDWEPRECSGDSLREEVASLSRWSPKPNDEASPLPNELTPDAASLQLERLSSGHMYWSDSPKRASRNSQGKAAALDLSFRSIHSTLTVRPSTMTKLLIAKEMVTVQMVLLFLKMYLILLTIP